MDVTEQLLHPGELLGAGHFQRPPELAANVMQLSDRAVVRTPASALNLLYGEAPPTAAPAAPDALASPAAPVASDTVAPDTVPPDTVGVGR
jgi:hypothetical protein